MPLKCSICGNEVKDDQRFMLMVPNGSVHYLCSPACLVDSVEGFREDSSQATSVVINLDGKTIARALIPHLNDEFRKGFRP
jgi:hypothetical protein